MFKAGNLTISNFLRLPFPEWDATLKKRYLAVICVPFSDLTGAEAVFHLPCRKAAYHVSCTIKWPILSGIRIRKRAGTDMKLKTLKHMLVMFLVNHLCDGAYLFELKRKLLNAIGYSLGEGTKVVGPIYCTAKLVTGSNCWLGRNFTIHGNGVVEMGDNCDIAPDVTFLTGRHAIISQEDGAAESRKYSIRVGEGCWIGAGTTLGRNVTIGKGCMILASACVMKNMPEKTLIGGVPARIVRKLDDIESYE